MYKWYDRLSIFQGDNFMGFFKSVEDTVNKGLGVFNETVAKTVNGLGDATKGWGEKADAWLADDSKFDKMKEEANEFFDKASEATDDIVADIKEFVAEAAENVKESYERAKEESAKKKADEDEAKDIVDEVFADDATVAEDVQDDVEDETVVVTVETEFIVVATTLEDGDIVVPVEAEDDYDEYGFSDAEYKDEEDTLTEEEKAERAAQAAELTKLRVEAKALGVKGVIHMNKDELVAAIAEKKK